MLLRFLQATSSLTARRPVASLWLPRGGIVASRDTAWSPSPGLAALLPQPSPLLPQYRHQQTRNRWTKAKKKRYERFERRQKLAEHGIALPKPPYYTPILPVANALDREAQTRLSAESDAIVSAQLQERLALLKEQPPMLRLHMTGLHMSDRVKKLFDLQNGNQQEVVKAQKAQGMQLFELREGDTGSTPVQIIALTTRIQQLQTHMTKHKKDNHSKRGMDALFVRRRKLLDYLERKNFDAYRKVVKTLGLMRT